VAGRLRIGRAADNELVVPDLLVSRHHAELRRTKRGWTLIDLGSANGSYVDGVRARHPVELADGQRVTFGNQTFVAVPDGLAPAEAAVVGTALPALAARDLTVQVESGATILDHVSFALEPGQLLAIVGPTGSGKSTLLKALTGSRRPEGGSVEVRGVPLYDAYDELCRTIGYVPQDDILHLPLTIRQALEFGAELRFPADTTDEDRARRVDEVLAELALTHRGDVPIEKVSGGQRKRTSVALELLTRPELLFLDEPTSGLDPGFERTVMELLRELADAGRAVVVVTHSLQSLELCDRVLFLAPGGAIAFFGEPADALGFFGRSDFIEVFRDLEASTPERWSSRGHDRRGEVRAGGDATGPVLAAPRAAPPGQPWKRQVGILARRQRAILQADRQNRWFLAGSVLVPAILILMLVPSNQLSLGQARPVSPRLLLSAIVVATVAMGAANAIREIVKEVPIYLRERAVGLQRSAYLASKLLVVGTLTMAQAAALVLITTLRAGGPDRANVLVQGHLELMVDVALTGLSAVALGLALSTLVSSSEKAMALVPVVFVVQWLFCGAAFNLESRPVMREAARLTSANWGMAAAASSVGENELSHTCSDPPHYADDTGVTYDDYGTPYIDPEVEAKRKAEASRRELAGTCDRRWESRAGPWFTSITALVLLTVGAMWLADRLLARKEPLAAQRASDWPSPWDHGPRREF
jgi:ABC-type multidrug transport system ATPase subunit